MKLLSPLLPDENDLLTGDIEFLRQSQLREERVHGTMQS